MVFVRWFCAACLCSYYRLPDRNAVISYGYDTVPKYIFFIYRYFPLLYEMRNVLDWTCASTSLCVVDIYIYVLCMQGPVAFLVVPRLWWSNSPQC